MSKKVSGFLKGLMWFCLTILIIIGAIYISCKYIIKDSTIIAQVQTKIENFGRNILGTQKTARVELKDENFKSEVEEAKYYHYIQLDDNAKQIYIVLENNIDNFKSGKEEVELPTDLGKMMETENGQKQLQQSFQDAWDAFSKDKPELFYLDGNKFCLVTKSIQSVGNVKYELAIGKGENQNYFAEGFSSEKEVDKAISEFKSKEAEIAKLISIDNPEYTYSYEKILKVHDWLVDNLQYDSELKQLNNGNSYGALIEKKAICEGYAEAFKCMMDQLEVPCITICGTSKDSATGKEEKHAWNYVYIEEKWYAVDVTWDDPIINIVGRSSGNVSSNLKYKYFLKGENTMKQDHIVTGEIVEDGKRFSYPELSKQDYEK